MAVGGPPRRRQQHGTLGQLEDPQTATPPSANLEPSFKVKGVTAGLKAVPSAQVPAGVCPAGR